MNSQAHAPSEWSLGRRSRRKEKGRRARKCDDALHDARRDRHRLAGRVDALAHLLPARAKGNLVPSSSLPFPASRAVRSVGRRPGHRSGRNERQVGRSRKIGGDLILVAPLPAVMSISVVSLHRPVGP